MGGNTVVKDGQIHLNNFTGADIKVDGNRGLETVKGGIMVLQTALNMDYRAGLTVDGILGAMTLQALGSHYVASKSVSTWSRPLKSCSCSKATILRE
ncbi:MAG: peptidoglycan-binding domain-containing protein [Blautia marasmi]